MYTATLARRQGSITDLFAPVSFYWYFTDTEAF